MTKCGHEFLSFLLPCHDTSFGANKASLNRQSSADFFNAENGVKMEKMYFVFIIKDFNNISLWNCFDVKILANFFFDFLCTLLIWSLWFILLSNNVTFQCKNCNTNYKPLSIIWFQVVLSGNWLSVVTFHFTMQWNIKTVQNHISFL